MPNYKENINIKCSVGGDEELTFVKIELTDNLDNYITTLEYADITNDFDELVEINDQAMIYDDEKQLKEDLAKGKLDRYLGKAQANERLDLLLGLRLKFKHQSGSCGNDCIYCNPDLGNDPFPDFTFVVKNATPEGNA